jgi:hypothetical protein
VRKEPLALLEIHDAGTYPLEVAGCLGNARNGELNSMWPWGLSGLSGARAIKSATLPGQ